MTSTTPHQFEICLAPHRTDDSLREKLAAHVEAFNGATDPEERIEHHTAIVRLRGMLERNGGV